MFIFRSIFVLYLMLSSNFLAGLFGCKTQQEFKDNMFLKHLTGFMIMYFFIILASKDIPQNHLLLTLFAYLLFIITSRMDFKWWIGFIVGLCILFILQDYTKDKDDDTSFYDTLYTILYGILIFIVFVGFTIYYGRKKVEYGKDFNLKTFFLGVPLCSLNVVADGLSDKDAFLSAFKF